MYDTHKSYQQNYSEGPNPFFLPNHRFPKIEYTDQPKFKFLGIPLFIPFGVPAGPLLNAKFVQVALDAGFCLPTYKTVRSAFWDCYPLPNILKIHNPDNTQLFFDSRHTVVGTPFTKNDYFQKKLSISNSFGVPSQAPEHWSKDFETLKPYAKIDGVHVVLSFQGSKNKKNLYDDISRTCEYAIETVQKTDFCLLEINLSCPNEANEPIYKSRQDSVHALKSAYDIVSQHKNIKLIAKIGAMNFEDTYAFVSDVSPYLHALSAINTVSANIVNEQGDVVLGSRSKTGGVCGAAILAQGLLMCETLAQSRERCGLNSDQLGLIGVGGVFNTVHFKNYRDAGADVVQSATGMMWNLNLAAEIAQTLKVSFREITNTENN